MCCILYLLLLIYSFLLIHLIFVSTSICVLYLCNKDNGYTIRLALLYLCCRYLAASRPQGGPITRPRAFMIMGCLWLYNILLASPWLGWGDVYERPGNPRIYCKNIVPADWEQFSTGLSIYTRIANYFIPLTVTWIAYMGIICHLQASKRRVC